MPTRLMAIFMLVVRVAAGGIPQAGLDGASAAVFVDGQYVDADGLITVEDGRVWGPLRAVAEALGADEVTWDEREGAASVRRGKQTLTARVGEEYVSAAGRYFYAPGGVRMEEGRVLVPLSALAAFFGAELTYDERLRLAEFTAPGKAMTKGSRFYDADDLCWLSRIIEAEARGETLAGKIAVGNVVLERVADPAFPSTVESVIFDTTGGVQFSPTRSGNIYNEPGDESVIAAKIALEGEVVVRALYFSMAKNAETCWAAKHCEFVTELGGHVFFI